MSDVDSRVVDHGVDSTPKTEGIDASPEAENARRVDQDVRRFCQELEAKFADRGCVCSQNAN